MKYPLPISIPKGRTPIITQPYGDKTSVAWYKANGVNIDEHNGTDIVVSGNTAQESRFNTYGAKLVCPVKSAYLDKSWWDNPMSSKGNGIQIAWTDGNFYQMLVWHCSELNLKSSYKEGETIALIGNSGLVRPKPSVECAHCGSHVHLMVYKDGVLTDPETVFDKSRWFTSDDTDTSKDLAPIKYFLAQISTLISNLFKK